MPTKIAIIEDDVAIVQMYRGKFEREGYQVESAGDGAAGIRLIKQWHPDVVLLDLMMPNVGGVAMLEEMNRDAALKPIKVVVLTNMGDPATAHRVLKLGADDYIVKADMTPNQVAQKISRVLQGAAQPANRPGPSASRA